jgi:hypothetical protein
MPCGKGSVQVFDVPSCVIAIDAVAEPLYVITSRRSWIVGVPPAIVTDECIERITVPAVG